MRKRIIVALLLCFSLLILCGCTEKDITTEKKVPDGEKIVGEWYDTESKGYFVFRYDGTFITGYGLHTENSGGVYDIENNKLTLTPIYSIYDGKRQDILLKDQKPIIMDFRFNFNNDLYLSTENYNFSLSLVPEENGTTKKEIGENMLKGLYKSEEETLFYYFDGNGIVNKSTNPSEKTYTGSYSVYDGTLLFSYDSLSESYQFESINDHEFSLTDANGKTTHYSLVNTKN